MKIWLKILIGSVLGIGSTFLFDAGSTGAVQFVENSSEIVLRIGRYIFIPLMFFSLTVAIHELRQIKKLFRVLVRGVVYLLISSAVLAVLGTLSVLLLKPARIPIIVEEAREFAVPTIREILLAVFPENLFTLFTGSGDFILPFFLLALLLGLHFAFDAITTKPVLQFFDAMNRILYQVNTFVTEIIGIGFIAVTARFVYGLTSTEELVLFRQVIILLAVDTAVILLGLFPLVLYFFGGRKNPYAYLYGILAPLFGAFLSGSIFFSLPLLVRHGKENLGIPRRVGSVTYPLFTMFGRAGTAMVISISFVVILKSYSSLGINVSGALWVILFSFLLSFATGSFPSVGIFVSLSVLCSIYGRGIEEGYLILAPLVPILVSFSVLVDIAFTAFNSLLISIHEGQKKEVEPSAFI